MGTASAWVAGSLGRWVAGSLSKGLKSLELSFGDTFQSMRAKCITAIGGTMYSIGKGSVIVHLPSPCTAGEGIVLGAAGALHYPLTHEASRLGQVLGSPATI